MVITEIQVSLTNEEIKKRDGILAFVRLVFENSFAVRDIKVMEREGTLYLGMPSRKIMEPCKFCKRKIGLKDNYCHNCGRKVISEEITNGSDRDEIKKYYLDVAYPINQVFRSELEKRILIVYNNMVDSEHKLSLRT